MEEEISGNRIMEELSQIRTQIKRRLTQKFKELRENSEIFKYRKTLNGRSSHIKVLKNK